MTEFSMASAPMTAKQMIW